MAMVLISTGASCEEEAKITAEVADALARGSQCVWSLQLKSMRAIKDQDQNVPIFGNVGDGDLDLFVRAAIRQEGKPTTRHRYPAEDDVKLDDEKPALVVNDHVAWFVSPYLGSGELVFNVRATDDDGFGTGRDDEGTGIATIPWDCSSNQAEFVGKASDGVQRDDLSEDAVYYEEAIGLVSESAFTFLPEKCLETASKGVKAKVSGAAAVKEILDDGGKSVTGCAKELEQFFFNQGEIKSAVEIEYALVQTEVVIPGEEAEKIPAGAYTLEATAPGTVTVPSTTLPGADLGAG